jgi:hypothetical protein
MLKRRPFSETMNKFTSRIINNIKKVDILFSEWGRQFYARPEAQNFPAMALASYTNKMHCYLSVCLIMKLYIITLLKLVNIHIGFAGINDKSKKSNETSDVTLELEDGIINSENCEKCIYLSMRMSELLKYCKKICSHFHWEIFRNINLMELRKHLGKWKRLMARKLNLYISVCRFISYDVSKLKY